MNFFFNVKHWKTYFIVDEQQLREREREKDKETDRQTEQRGKETSDQCHPLFNLPLWMLEVASFSF